MTQGDYSLSTTSQTPTQLPNVLVINLDARWRRKQSQPNAALNNLVDFFLFCVFLFHFSSN